MIFRPSVVFGPGDAFINNFAGILKLTPGVLPLACAEAKFAPVYVGDVAEAFVRCLDRRDVVGRAYELCGPDVMSLGEIVRETARILGLRRARHAAAESAVSRAGRGDGLRAGQAVLDRQLPLGHAGFHLQRRRAR